jgi:2C-methyl-D-erythritol 2,4-cyclodiphosphate synthase
MSYIYVSTIGQDSHRFCSAEEQNGQRELVLGGLVIPGEKALAGTVMQMWFYML